MKKTLALILAFALVFSTITVAFAEEATIGADAKVCADLGMLVGDGNGVTAAYLATTPTRLQAAIMVLRLKGLEAEAKAFTGTDNFADGNIAWAEGKAILAYLKANPQLGWQGDGTKFDPNAPMTAKAYYKVMLEALGYKQNSATVVGDFTWDNVVEFAASKGLAKVASVANFTVNDLAAATTETLKAVVKDSAKTLVATLVEAGKVDKAKAVAAGVYVDAATTTTAALKAVKAIGNTKVEVEFTAAVEKAFAENVANYKVVVKDTTTALEVKAAVLDGTKKVVLETAAQTTGKAYTLTVGAVAKNFGGLAKETAAPELDKVEGTDTERVELTFTKIMDLATALDVNNYKIDGATVEAAAWADSSRKIVELTTKGLVAGKTYKVTVTNVKSVDAVVLKSASKNFMSKSDKKAPEAAITKAKCTNTRIIVQFNEVVDKASAENLANYKLTVGTTTTNSLDITAAKLVEDANDDETIVELTTVPQKSGQKYILRVNGVADTSVLGNKITKEQKVDYYGVGADTTKPTVAAVNYLTNKIIQVDFTETSRLDFTAAQDLNNYSINNDVTIEKVEMKDADDADCKSVRLTVSELGEKTSYQIVIKNIADEYGNVMGEKKFNRTFNKATVNTPATVAQVASTGLTTVKVIFTKEVDSATAKDVANYSINGDIGTPVKTSFGSDDKSVTLTTNEMTANKEYKITINGVKDLAGNTISNVTVKYVVSATENDIDAPEIEDITAVNDRVIRVTFNEPIDVSGTAPTITVNNGSDITATYKVSTDDDDMVLEFLMNSYVFGSEADVNFVSTTAKDLAGNVCTDKDIIFSSTAEDPEKPELLSAEQVTVKKFKLQYSEKIALPGAVTIPVQTADGAKVPYELTVSKDADDDTIIYLTSSQKMPEEKLFQLNLVNFDNSVAGDGDVLANFHGTEVAQDDNNRTVIETTLVDEEAPYIVDVVAENRETVVITYSEEMALAGTYGIHYYDNDGKKVTITGHTASLTDDAEVTIDLSSASKKLESKYTYTLTIGTTKAQDIAYNKVDKDATFDFAGTDVVAVGNYITGVKVLNGTKVEARTFTAQDPAAATVTYKIDTTTTVSATPAVVGTSGKVFTLTIKDTTVDTGVYRPVSAWVEGRTYTVTLAGMTATFKGTVESGVTVEEVGTDFVFNYDEVKNGDEIVITRVAGGPAYEYAVAASGVAKIAQADLSGWTTVNILVLRNGVALYYAEEVTLP